MEYFDGEKIREISGKTGMAEVQSHIEINLKRFAEARKDLDNDILKAIAKYISNSIEDLHKAEDMLDVSTVSNDLSKLVRVLNEIIFKMQN